MKEANCRNPVWRLLVMFPLLIFQPTMGEEPSTGADGALPEVFVDRDNCMGESCGYCELLIANTAIRVYAEPDTESDVVGVVRAGEALISKKGEVHTVPTRFVVIKENKDIISGEVFVPGDDVFVLTPLGEGEFRVFHNGELTAALLDFNCAESEYCWGELVAELDSTQWLYVISESRAAGWIIADGSVRGVIG